MEIVNENIIDKIKCLEVNISRLQSIISCQTKLIRGFRGDNRTDLKDKISVIFKDKLLIY